MHVVLVEPRIPPNTGNVARLCAATRLPLHLVEPLGFKISDRHLRRAGLDYWDHVELHRHPSLAACIEKLGPARLSFFSTRGKRPYTEAAFREGDCLIFGSETRGLPEWVFEDHPDAIWRIPMFHPKVRSLNLSSAVAAVVYEALRQTGRLAGE